MRLAKRLVVGFPLAIAAVLSGLMVAADRLHLHREHIAGYGFLFSTPWAWLIDHSWLPQFTTIHNYWVQAVVGYAFILWIPAFLYSACPWLLLFGLGTIAARFSR
jgi:hypothetical protein